MCSLNFLLTVPRLRWAVLVMAGSFIVSVLLMAPFSNVAWTNKKVDTVMPVTPSGATQTAIQRPLTVIQSSEIQEICQSNLTVAFVRNEERLSHIVKTCAHMRELKNAPSEANIWVSPSFSLAFCVVPKVGCTYWKRTLRFLDSEHENIQFSNDISRYDVHHAKMHNLYKTRLYDYGDETRALGPALKFMFARDPYTRIWSAYLDKFVLPLFWHTGKEVVKEMRNNATKASLECGHDITFKEFLFYIFRHVNGTWPEVVLNEHFKPVVFNCNPCKHHFDVVGKAETFTSDSELIFASSGFFRENTSNKEVDHDMSEVNDIVEYNFDFKYIPSIYGKIYRTCLSYCIIAERLWKVFQYNGYIGFEITLPEHFRCNNTNTGKKKFAKHLVDVIKQARANAEQTTLARWKKQRVQSMRGAYRSLPNDALKAFQRTFKIDFLLFQYEPVPSWLESG